MRKVQPTIASLILAISSAIVFAITFFLSTLIDNAVADLVVFSFVLLPAIFAGYKTTAHPLAVVAMSCFGLFLVTFLFSWAFSDTAPWGFAGFLIPGFIALFVFQSIVCIASYRLRVNDHHS